MVEFQPLLIFLNNIYKYILTNFSGYNISALSQNVSIQTVSKYMKYSDTTVTLKVYAHFIPDTQEKVVFALNNIKELDLCFFISIFFYRKSSVFY